MNSERASGSVVSRSWFEKIGQVLSNEPKDKDQLLELLHLAQQRDLLDVDALAMIEGVLQVAEMRVRDIMVPRSQMVVVDRDGALDDILPVVIDSAHSRFPVIGDNKDEVVGIVLAKDLLAVVHGMEEEGNAYFNIRDVLRTAVFIPESKRLNVLLKEFRSSRNHMAIVVDEYGGVAGLVTIEDVLEQIVGEIADEHDIIEEDSYIKEINDTEFTVKALTPVEDFNEHFSTKFSDEEFDTIGGIVINQFGRMPKRGEVVAIDDFHFKVLHSDSRRLRLLQVVRSPASDQESQS